MERDEIPAMQVKINHLVEFSPVELQQIREEAAKDVTLQILSEQVIQEWPGSVKKTQQAINSIQEGVVPLGSRIIVPESLRQKVM
jgi:hypothetical protein